MTTESMNLNRLFSLQGKVALVTGGSRGIGYMIAQGLLEAGASVYITARKAEACEQAAHELSQYGNCQALPSNVAEEHDRLALVTALEDKHQGLDILVNNAGIAWGGSFEDYPEAGFDKVMHLNVTSVFTLTRDLTPMLERAGNEDDPSRVINIGSMEGLHIPVVHEMENYAYTSSKAATHHLTRHLAVELGSKNITVNAIAPGFFPSKMTKHLFAGDKTGPQIASNSLLGRTGRAEEMAGVAVYLSSRAGAYTHGAVIPVDGGTSINHRHS